jgi:hypothetical protein
MEVVMDGWIKLHRKILEWEWYADVNVRLVFIHLLLKANHTDKKWMGVDIKRGQLVTGRVELAKQIGISERNVRTAITKLKSTSELTSKSTNKYTVLTITNYDRYQEVTSKTPNERPATDHKQEYKNVKNINNTSLPASDKEILEALKPNAPITKDWQFLALDIIEKLKVPDNKRSSFFKACKEDSNICETSLRYAIDFPNPKIRWNMFFVKYNALKNANQNKNPAV